jgi:hypothetical protein
VTTDTLIACGAVAGVLQLALMAQLWRTSRAAAHGARRLEQLTSAMELLTDTTETGFVNVAAELTRVGARPVAPAATRRETTQRIAAARRDGLSVAAIAASEGLSESEVKLHLGLEEPAAVAGAPARPADPHVLDDLEQWMRVLEQDRRGGGARRAR